MAGVEQELGGIGRARALDGGEEWGGKGGLAREVGVGEDAINEMAKSELERLSDDERVVVEVARELMEKHRASDAVFERARKRFGDTGVIELTATVGYYAMIACVLNATEIEPPEGSPRLP